VANLPGYAICNLLDGAQDWERAGRASVEAHAFNGVNNDPFRSEVEDARKLDGLGDAEGVAG
jgi:hypothetical protein